jgi:hypothetical protein
MFLLKIAGTAYIVHIISQYLVKSAYSLENQLKQLAAGKQPETPRYSMAVQIGTYWVSIIAGLAGIWSL